MDTENLIRHITAQYHEAQVPLEPLLDRAINKATARLGDPGLRLLVEAVAALLLRWLSEIVMVDSRLPRTRAGRILRFIWSTLRGFSPTVLKTPADRYGTLQ